ncbi:MAG TPA: TonB-dependent receptor [Candidatus Binatia bacterium]|jgi:TonB-dependent receptor
MNLLQLSGCSIVVALAAGMFCTGSATADDVSAGATPATSSSATQPSKKTKAAAETPQSDAAPGTGASAPDSSVEEVVVTGSSISEALDQARFSESIVDVLTAKDFAVTGDSNVVDALSRVTGVTTVGDKYVYVRGLGERYSSTLFNGAMLPSPDPFRRVIPLDLFPSGVMDQLSVQKTYAPYLPADFSGGSVQLKTRSVPAEPETRLSLSSEYRVGTTFSNREWYEGSSQDWTGFDGSYRHLPKNIDDLQNASAAETQQLGLDMNRSFDVDNKTLPPNFKLKGSLARDYKLYMGDVGFLIGGEGYNAWQHYMNGHRQSSGLDPSSTDQSETDNNIKYSLLSALQWKPTSQHELDTNVFYTHNTYKRYVTYQTFNAGNINFVDDIRSDWQEQQLWSVQLAGNHNPLHMHDLGIDWAASYADASRVEPDSRFYRFDVPYTYDPVGNPVPHWDQKVFDTDVNSNEKDWEALTDHAWDAHLNTQLPFKLSDSISTTLKAGTRYFDKQRDSERRVFHFQTTNPGNKYDNLPIGAIFDDPNIGSRFDQWQLQGFLNALDSYSAEEQIIAGYAQSETDLWSKLHLMAGARYETSKQTITQGPETPFPFTKLDKAGFYPGAEATWLFTDALQLRAAFSQTVNRPDLREISPASYFNFEDGYRYVGNPNLKVAELTNYDLRLEWYHGTADDVSIASFYKDLKDPIEQVFQPAGNIRTWQNADTGRLYGIEVEARQSLASLGRWAEDFSTRANAAWIDSQAKTDPANSISPLQHPSHALQGQAPWIVNWQLTWSNLPTDTDATIAFNTSGKYIKDLGTVGFDDSYQHSKPELDLTFRHGFQFFGDEYNLTLKARNLIDPVNKITRNTVNPTTGETTSSVTELSYRKGQLFSIEISRDF